MNEYAQSSSVARRATERPWTLILLKGLVVYFVISSITLPFVDSLWVSEVPVIAIVQLPKVMLANWLRTDVVMPVISALGLSAGSFSPDYGTARPYALAIAYLLPVSALLVASVVRSRMASRYRLWSCLLLCTAALDFLLTLALAEGPGLALY